MYKLAPIFVSLFGAVAAAAHPGHGVGDGTGLAHHLTDPLHVLGLAVGLLAAAAGVRLLRRRRASVRTLR